jgi:hypothetical protein
VSNKQSSGEVQFVDTPAPETGKGVKLNLSGFAAALKSHPRQWAIYIPRETQSYNTLSAMCSYINKQHVKAPVELREGFQAAFREGVLYVRYIGGEQ